MHGSSIAAFERSEVRYKTRPIAAYRLLGGLRFSLAMMVVSSHTFVLAFGDGSRDFIAQIGIGNVAVNGFFVLSGFIIAEAVHLFYTGRPGAFLINRALRLVPPFWAATLVSIFVHAWLSRLGVLKLPDYEILPADMFAPDNLIVQITAIIPIFNFNRVLDDARGAYYFVRFAWAVFVEFVFVHISGDRGARFLALVAYTLVGLHFFRYVQGQTGMSMQAVYGIAQPRVLVASLMMLSLPIVLMLLVSLQVSQRTARVDKWFGDLTYPLYLNHYIVLVAIWSLVEQRSWATQVMAMGLALALAYVMKLAVDVPVASLRDWVRGLRLLEAKTA
jgi:peptidoglycan/LPS O-acetylase OafA/YrhL